MPLPSLRAEAVRKKGQAELGRSAGKHLLLREGLIHALWGLNLGGGMKARTSLSFETWQ